MPLVLVYFQDIVDNTRVLHNCISVQALGAQLIRLIRCHASHVIATLMHTLTLSDDLHVSLNNAMPRFLGEMFVSHLAFSAGRIHDPVEQEPSILSQSSKVRGAVSALVGTPQVVYMYRQNQVRLLKYKGVHQNFEGEFTARAPIGRGGAPKRLGQYSNMLAAAQAYDAAMFQRFGMAAKYKLNFPAEHIRSIKS